MPHAGEIALPFLGHRSYLQGPTLFDAMRIGLPSTASLSCKISHRISTDRLSLHDLGSDQKIANYPALLSWTSGGAAGVIGALPLAPSPNPSRIPYDEALVTDRTVFAERSATLSAASPYSFAATITSMLKALLLRAAPRSEPGQWLFARLDLEHVPSEFALTSVDLDETLVGGRFVRASVRLA